MVYIRQIQCHIYVSRKTAYTLQFFFLAMALYPDVQVKARAELDTVVGPNRLPTFKDRDTLVYTNAIIKEVLRWRPIVPLGMAHRVTQEDIYRGYLIPEGSVIIINAWWAYSIRLVCMLC